MLARHEMQVVRTAGPAVKVAEVECRVIKSVHVPGVARNGGVVWAYRGSIRFVTDLPRLHLAAVWLPYLGAVALLVVIYTCSGTTT